MTLVETGDLWTRDTLFNLIVGQVAARGNLKTFSLSLGLDWDVIVERAGTGHTIEGESKRVEPDPGPLLETLNMTRFLADKREHERQRGRP